MKLRRASSPFADNDDNHNAPSGDPVNTHLPGRRRFRVSPIAALAIAIAALVWLFGLKNNRFGFLLRNQPLVSPEEAVDISLKRLMRTHVAERFERDRRLTSSTQTNREIIDDELARIREHPLYALIKKQMTDHPRDEGHAEVQTIAGSVKFIAISQQEIERACRYTTIPSLATAPPLFASGLRPRNRSFGQPDRGPMLMNSNANLTPAEPLQPVIHVAHRRRRTRREAHSLRRSDAQHGASLRTKEPPFEWKSLPSKRKPPFELVFDLLSLARCHRRASAAAQRAECTVLLTFSS